MGETESERPADTTRPDVPDTGGPDIPDQGRTGAPVSLPAWAAGTLHAALLVGIAIEAIHLVGAVGELLQGVGTVAGAAVFGYLWVVSVWTAHRALGTLDVSAAGTRPALRAVLRSALVWGFIAGALFVAGLFLPLAGALAVVDGVQELPATLVFGLIVAAVAGIVGAIVGGVLALVDVLLFVAAAWTSRTGDG